MKVKIETFGILLLLLLLLFRESDFYLFLQLIYQFLDGGHFLIIYEDRGSLARSDESMYF